MSPIQKLALHPFTGRYFCVEASPSDAAIMMAEIFLTLSAATRLGISATIAGTMTGEWVDSSETKHVAVMSVCDSTHVLLEPSRHTMMPAGTHKIPLALDFREVIAPGVSMLEVPPTFQCEGGRVAYTLQVTLTIPGIARHATKTLEVPLLVLPSGTHRSRALLNAMPISVSNLRAPGTFRPLDTVVSDSVTLEMLPPGHGQHFQTSPLVSASPAPLAASSGFGGRRRLSNADSGLSFQMDIEKPVVFAGDLIACQLTCHTRPGRRIAKVVLSLHEYLEFDTSKFGVITNKPRVLEAVDADDWDPAVPSRLLTLPVPMDVADAFSLNVGLINHRFIVRMNVVLEGQSCSTALVETEIVILKRGNLTDVVTGMPILPRTASLHGACDLPMRTQPTPRTNEEETTTASLHLSEATTAASTTTLTELDASSPALTHGGMTPESHASSLMASPRVGVIAHGSPQADMALPPPAVDAHAHTHAMAASYSFAESPIMPPETRPSSPVRGDGLVSSAGAVTLASRAKDPRKPFQVAYAYQPTRADELRLTPGQRVFMTRVFPDGWAYVECPHEQTLGMIPLHHLQAEIVLGTRLTHVGGRHLRKVSVVHPSAAHAVAARARASSFMSSASSPVLPIAMPSPSAMRSPMSGDGVVVGSMGGGDGRSLGLAYTSHIDPSLQTKHQTTDWRFLCRCEPRYQLWIDCLKDSQMAAGFVGVPPVAAIPVFNRARSRREMGTPDACARCSGQRADHASVL